MIIAIRWLLERLDKAEVKSDQRDEERAKNMAMIATMTLQNQTVIEQNSEVLVEVKNALKTK
jgi:transposase